MRIVFHVPELSRSIPCLNNVRNYLNQATEAQEESVQVIFNADAVKGLVRGEESAERWRILCDQHRWCYVLTETEDVHVAEQIVQHIAWCRQQVPQKRPGELILSANDLRYIDKVARKLGCGPIARHWIE
ncbi:hypothetical protein CPV46_17450 [Salmonella enterica]|nr:hypothetical protein [Salmonella enterica]EBE5359876.1 hypothetical protein [Salmonella enterica]EBF3387072.1 hypothetical protein [Salmonella enterica]EBK3459054.1 hypothetical protein [Salmonella enterica]EEA2955542.1 hypothetical protein [Salmonella enterica subsp. enterica serovar Muenchen]